MSFVCLPTRNVTEPQNDYAEATVIMKKMKGELECIKSINDKRLSELLSQKQAEISKLTNRINQYKLEFTNLKAKELEVVLMKSDIMNLFKRSTIPMPHSANKAPEISKGDWEALLDQIKLCIPSFYNFLISNHSLTPQEFRVCILTRLNFSNKEIATILKTGTQNIPNAKKRANNKLFSEDTAQTLQRNLLHIVHLSQD